MIGGDTRFLDMREAAAHMGQTVRWLRRHWVDLIGAGVAVYRVPKGSPKGRLMFQKESLDKYMESCRLKINV